MTQNWAGTGFIVWPATRLLLSYFFKLTTNKTSKLCITGFSRGEIHGWPVYSLYKVWVLWKGPHYIGIAFRMTIICNQYGCDTSGTNFQGMMHMVQRLSCFGVSWCNVMMTSSNGNIFRGTGPLCGKFAGLRWIPRTKAIAAELWYFLWYAPE